MNKSEPTSIRRSLRRPARKDWSKLGYLNDDETEKSTANDHEESDSPNDIELPALQPTGADRPVERSSNRLPKTPFKFKNNAKTKALAPLSKSTESLSETDYHQPSTSATNRQTTTNRAFVSKHRVKNVKKKSPELIPANEDEVNQRVLMIGLDCQICGETLPNRLEVARHLKAAHNKPPYKCLAIGCDQWFDREGILGSHVRKAHSDLDGRWPCEFCCGLYRTHNLLYKHIWDLHATGKFICGFPGCDFGPLSKRNIIRQHYVKEHDAERFRCRFCRKPFNAMSGMRHHERTHTGFRPFLCTWPGCNHSSVVKCSMVTHVRSCHFKIPRTLKKQLQQKGKLDHRDPNEWIAVDPAYNIENPLKSTKGTKVPGKKRNFSTATEAVKKADTDEHIQSKVAKEVEEMKNKSVAPCAEQVSDANESEAEEFADETDQYETDQNDYIAAEEPTDDDIYYDDDDPTIFEVDFPSGSFAMEVDDSDVDESMEGDQINLQELAPAQINNSTTNKEIELILLSSDDEDN